MNRVSLKQNPQFGSAATAVAIVHVLDDRKRKQQDPNYACPLETMGRYAYGNLANGMQKQQNPIFSFTPTSHSSNTARLRFQGQHSSPHFDTDQLLENGVEGVAVWGLTKGVEEVGQGVLVAGEERYKILKAFEEMPVELGAGKTYLTTAKSADNPRYYYQKAEDSFVTAVTKSRPHTHKSHAYRHAAIAAKLRGDNGAARAHKRNAAKPTPTRSSR